MTALKIIQRIKALSPRERRKVFKFVYAHEIPNAVTQRALTEDLGKARRFDSVSSAMAELKR